MRAALAVLLAILGASCSLSNPPDRDFGTGGTGGRRVELLCSNQTDDDGDQLDDCDDPDCAEEPNCCERQRSALSEAWTNPDLSIDWRFAPSMADPWSPQRPAEGGRITGFVPDDIPRALVSDDCVPMALGASVSVALRASEPGDCGQNAGCERYAALVLTHPQDMLPGQRLQDELAVSMYAGGFVQLTQNGTPIATRAVALSLNHMLEISLKPARDENGHASLSATVSLTPEGGNRRSLVEGFPVASIEDLVSVGSCVEVAGLHVAVEGRGTGVELGPLQASQQDCANPSHFDERSATLTRQTLGASPPWTEAYVGAPTLGSSRTPASDVQWDVWIEGSNDPPELETFVHVGYALGHARATSDEGQNWSLGGWEMLSGPKLGHDPPSCVEVPCGEPPPSFREPHLLAEPNEEPASWVLSFAREQTPAAARDSFGIDFLRPVGPPAARPQLSSVTAITPGQVEGCESLRDPALIPVDPLVEDGYWLFFTCVRDDAMGNEIQALRVSADLALVEEAGVPLRQRVLHAEMLPEFAAQGVQSPEPLIRFTAQGARLRLWFVALSGVGERSIGVAEANAQDAGTLRFELPRFESHPVNPILSQESTVVRNRCGQEEQCSISGIAVSPRADEPERLRFLLARRVKGSDGMGRDELIPLEQDWRVP